MPGQTIDILTEDGKRCAGYLSIPESGSGPGLVLLQHVFGADAMMRAAADLFAEEGYVVLLPDLFWRLQPGLELSYDAAGESAALGYLRQFDFDQGVVDIGSAVQTLKDRPQCNGKVGAIGFCLGGTLTYLSAARLPIDVAIGFCLGGTLTYLSAARLPIDVAVAFYGVGIDKHLDEADKIACPIVFHFGARDDLAPAAAIDKIKAAFAGRNDASICVYPDAGHGFYLPGRGTYHKRAAGMAHSPTIAALRQAIGPRYDLVALWEKHCEYEFGSRDAAATMRTMVARPYVNHVPTMTGGVGHDELQRFYANHFIPKLPKDTKLTSISRTVGADRLVDELLFCFTHDIEIDWLLPGVPPTGKYVEAPTVAIVHFRGDKLVHEHIYWDQASVLVQIGLVDPKGLPVAGIETARKMVDENLPSNTLMTRWAESEPD